MIWPGYVEWLALDFSRCRTSVRMRPPLHSLIDEWLKEKGFNADAGEVFAAGVRQGLWDEVEEPADKQVCRHSIEWRDRDKKIVDAMCDALRSGDMDALQRVERMSMEWSVSARRDGNPWYAGRWRGFRDLAVAYLDSMEDG